MIEGQLNSFEDVISKLSSGHCKMLLVSHAGFIFWEMGSLLLLRTDTRRSCPTTAA